MANPAPECEAPGGADASPLIVLPGKITWLGLVSYMTLLAGAIGLFFLVAAFGNGLTAPPRPAGARTLATPAAEQVDVVLHVVATLAAMIALGFVFGRLLRYVGQPPVIGEMLAGIVLGPSLLATMWPELHQVLIPAQADDPHGQVPAALKAVSQIGVILYMFLVGLELNASRLAGRAHAAVAVSHSSIVAPFALGMVLALGLYPVASHQGVPFTSFALFMGVAMAITAFPVLARILTDRGLAKTDLGGVALSCAAADDVTAWCLLALVVGIAQNDLQAALGVIGGAAAFFAGMFLIVGPLVRRVTRLWDAEEESPAGVRPQGNAPDDARSREARSGPLPAFAIPGTFLALLLAAWTTEAIGIHAVFGAFLFGAVIPHDGRLARDFTAKLKDPVTVLFLPAFFAYTGMRTQIGLVSGWEGWLWCLAIIFVATLGKFGGSLVAARLTGLSWRDAAALGTLMNTRGLMELIVLNIGLDLGVISPTLFAMMVVMALATTAATSPVLHWLLPGGSSQEELRSWGAP